MAFTSFHLYFDDVEVGQEWESQGRTVTEADIVNFAGLSGDFNPIHMDHVFAASTPFRKAIAHGLLVFSIGSGLTSYCPPMRTIAFMQVKEWNFKDAVFAGDTIRMKGKVVTKTVRGRGRRGEIVWQRTIVNQHDKVVQDGFIVTLVECRPVVKSVRHAEINGEAGHLTVEVG
jgi:3-hydroxybutyryl-CoA dehydratase